MIGSTPYPPSEGVASHVWGLAEYLLEKEIDVTIITRRRNREQYIERCNNITIIRPFYFPSYPFHVHLHGIFVSRILQQLGAHFDLIHYHTPLPPPVFIKKPSILTIHNMMLADSSNRKIQSTGDILNKLQSGVSFNIEKKLIRNCKAITVVSDEVREQVHRMVPDIKKEMITIPNGVDTDFFSPGSYPSFRDQYLLFVGRLDQQKGLEDLLSAMQQVVKHFPLTKLLIVGQGPLLPIFQEQVKRNELVENVFFQGQVTGMAQIRDFYRNAYALVCPSVYETGPRVVLEAMSCSTPVITTPVGIVPKVVEDGKNGFLTSIHNPTELAEKILLILKFPGIRKEFSENARDAVVSEFSIKNVGMKYLQVYKRFLPDGAL